MVGVPAITFALLLLAGGAPAPSSVTLHYWAVQATTEGREVPQFDERALPIRALLEDLSFDTFRTLSEAEEKAAAGKEKTAPLVGRYAMELLYSGHDETGRARVVVTVTLAPKEPGGLSGKVVQTTLLLAPGSKARVCGLRCETGGELIVVIGRQ